MSHIVEKLVMENLVGEEVATIVATTEPQCTIGSAVSISGVGLHTGCRTTLRLLPAPEGTGRAFRRTDIPGSSLIPARIESLFDTSRSTNLGSEEVRIHTVEHVLAALTGCGIDNVIIEMDNKEPPIGDSSAQPFVELIRTAGKVEQKEMRSIYKVNAPIFWASGEVQLVALPADNLTISYTLHHPESPLVGTQFLCQTITEETFVQNLARARTFGFYEDVNALVERGLIKGATLENALVFKGDKVLSSEGPRYSNEPVRHKILDLVGDVSLIGPWGIHAHIVAIRSGHTSNVSFTRVLRSKLRTKELI